MSSPENAILAAVFRLGLMIHKKLGPGLLESAYEAILAHELRKEGFVVRQQVSLPLTWDGLVFDKAFRADLLIDDLVIIEIKALADSHPVFARQLLTQLKVARLRLGAVVNFGLQAFKDGFERVANGMPD